jgi:glycosyltransferase involved in cell wall biosynthesis
VRVILAPRGQFSPGALSLKRIKKALYMWLFKFLGFHNNIYWHSTATSETCYINSYIGKDVHNIIHVPNLPDIVLHSRFNSLAREPGPLRIIFLSRISPKKNLEFLINCLSRITFAVDFRIYGIKEDLTYWNTCFSMLKALPRNISVEFFGSIPPSSVTSVFSQCDVFFFPTLGENFGHVIFEALSVGTCVVTSDQTPWVDMGDGALTTISLSDRNRWIDCINEWAHYSKMTLMERRVSAFKYSENYLRDHSSIDESRRLFNG